MGFKAHPHAITAYGTVLSKQAEHHADALSYLDKHVVVSEYSGGGLIVPAENYNPTILEIVRKAMERAESFFEASGTALKDTADLYRETDTETAAELDATYTDGESIVVDYPDGPTTYPTPAEQVDPTEQLTEPAEPKKFDNGPFIAVENINNYASITYWIRQLVIKAEGIDPFQGAADLIAGDWKAFAKASEACENLADFYADVFTNMKQYELTPYFWNGNAADLALYFFVVSGTYFVNDDDVAIPVECKGDEVIYTPPAYWGYYWALKLLSEAYMNLAKDVYDLANSIVSILNDILDITFWAIVAAGTGGVTSWSGIGAVLGAGGATVALIALAEKVADYSATIGKIATAVELFTGMDLLSDAPLYNLQKLNLPMPYSHPGL